MAICAPPAPAPGAVERVPQAAHTHARASPTCARARAHAHAHTHTHRHTRAHTDRHTGTHAHTHAHTHTPRAHRARARTPASPCAQHSQRKAPFPEAPFPDALRPRVREEMRVRVRVRMHVCVSCAVLCCAVLRACVCVRPAPPPPARWRVPMRTHVAAHPTCDRGPTRDPAVIGSRIKSNATTGSNRITHQNGCEFVHQHGSRIKMNVGACASASVSNRMRQALSTRIMHQNECGGVRAWVGVKSNASERRPHGSRIKMHAVTKTKRIQRSD